MSILTYSYFNSLLYSFFSPALFDTRTLKRSGAISVPKEPVSISDPRVSFLEDRIASLENGVAAVAAKSVKSIRYSLIKNLLEKGDNVVTFNSWALYTEDRKLYDRIGVTIRLSADGQLSTFKKLVDARTKLVYLETISPRFLNVPDFQKIISYAQSLGIPVVVDNTGGAGGYLTRPIDEKANLVIESLEDYLPNRAKFKAILVDGGNFAWSNGKYPKLSEGNYRLIQLKDGSELKGKGFFDVFNLLDFFRKRHFASQDAYLIPGDPFSLANRLEAISSKAQLKSDNALKLAKFLSNHPFVKSVQYTGFASNPSYFQTTSFFRNGFGHYLSFELFTENKNAILLLEELKQHFALKKRLTFDEKTRTFYLNVPAIEFEELKGHFENSFLLLEDALDAHYVFNEPLYSYYQYHI
jgi:O-acetylhomoserine (thiol)-lyase